MLVLVKHSLPAIDPEVPPANWRRLGLPSFVVLDDHELVDVVEGV